MTASRLSQIMGILEWLRLFDLRSIPDHRERDLFLKYVSINLNIRMLSLLATEE